MMDELRAARTLAARAMGAVLREAFRLHLEAHGCASYAFPVSAARPQEFGCEEVERFWQLLPEGDTIGNAA